jgi:hypothetical protein
MNTGRPGHSYLRTTQGLLSTSSGAASPVPDVAASHSSRGRLVEPPVPPSRRAAATSFDPSYEYIDMYMCMYVHALEHDTRARCTWAWACRHVHGHAHELSRCAAVRPTTLARARRDSTVAQHTTTWYGTAHLLKPLSQPTVSDVSPYPVTRTGPCLSHRPSERQKLVGR